LAVIVLSNLGMQPPGPLPTAGDLAHRIVTILVGNRLGPEWPAVVNVPPSVLDRYTGRYRLEAPPTVTGIMGDTIEVSREAEHLFAAGKLGRAEIFAQSETTFYARMGPLTISFLPGGNAVLDLMGLREFRLLRLP
jgi:hypothetical protein